MAAIARGLIPTGYEIALEDRSRTTWENVQFALPMAEHCDTVVFASDAMHCARARAYARAQRPDLADRLATADDYRFLERLWLKAPAATYELWMASRNRLRRHLA